MQGLSGVVYLVSLLALFIADALGFSPGVLILISLSAAVWLSFDIRGLANRASSHLLEVTALVNIGLILVFGAFTLAGVYVPFFLAGIASVIHGVGFVESRGLGLLAQTTGILEAATGACFIAGIPLVGAALALPTTALKIVLLRSEQIPHHLEGI